MGEQRGVDIEGAAAVGLVVFNGLAGGFVTDDLPGVPLLIADQLVVLDHQVGVRGDADPVGADGAVDGAVRVGAQPVDGTGDRVIIRSAVYTAVDGGAPFGIKPGFGEQSVVALVGGRAVDVEVVGRIGQELQRGIQRFAGQHFLGGGGGGVGVGVRQFIGESGEGNRRERQSQDESQELLHR